MPQFVGFLRGNAEGWATISPTEAQRALERYLAWSEELERAGGARGGGALSRGGRVIRRGGGDVAVTDGPFVEASEVLGGYIMVEASDLDEAEKVFSGHPHLEFGSIEVRKIGEQGCEGYRPSEGGPEVRPSGR